MPQSTTPTLIDPAAVRAEQLVNVDLGDGTYLLARRLDLTGMLFEGFVPQPLMTAAQRLVASRGLDDVSRLADLTDEDRVEQLDTLRRYAIVVGVTPKIVATDDGDPAHLPVTLLTLQQLLAIWNNTVVVPRVSAAQAAEFRRPPHRENPPPLHARESLRPPPQPLAGVEFKSA